MDVSEFIEAVPLPVILVRDDERIAATNRAAKVLLGPGMEGRHYVTILRQPLVLDCIEAALRLREASETQYTNAFSGRDAIYHVRAVPVAEGVLVTFEDRTAMHEAGQMRRDFVANVSHELRTPLTALMGFIETLRGPAREDAEARDRFLGIMEREAGRMNRLVSDLLSLSQVESEERMRPTDRVDVSAQVRSVISSLKPLAEQFGVSLTTEGAEMETIIPGDADQIAQVFTNLIENAIKYGGTGGEVTVCITRHESEPTLRGPAVRVDVADHGEGISARHIPRLTERFYRVDGHRSREMGGTGLGLAIVKHIVNRHRGRMRIESHKGQGSLFSVILPAS